eukprot:scaffold304614_cov14-Tisochrysis_lutea.AAC.1
MGQQQDVPEQQQQQEQGEQQMERQQVAQEQQPLEHSNSATQKRGQQQLPHSAWSAEPQLLMERRQRRVSPRSTNPASRALGQQLLPQVSEAPQQHPLQGEHIQVSQVAAAGGDASLPAASQAHAHPGPPSTELNTPHQTLCSEPPGHAQQHPPTPSEPLAIPPPNNERTPQQEIPPATLSPAAPLHSTLPASAHEAAP